MKKIILTLKEFFGKKRDFPKKYDVFHTKNVEILKMIYDNDLKYHEGEFKPQTWLRTGNLLNDNRNDELITNFAGISISYDLKAEIYELSLPVKFSKNFVYEIFDEIQKKYDVIKKVHSYTSSIKFKDV